MSPSMIAPLAVSPSTAAPAGAAVPAGAAALRTATVDAPAQAAASGTPAWGTALKVGFGAVGGTVGMFGAAMVAGKALMATGNSSIGAGLGMMTAGGVGAVTGAVAGVHLAQRLIDRVD